MDTPVISAKFLARLLKLEPEEYKKLRHGPLLSHKNNHGEVLQYYMHISPDNSEELLQKLGICEINFKVFSPKEVEKYLHYCPKNPPADPETGTMP